MTQIKYLDKFNLTDRASVLSIFAKDFIVSIRAKVKNADAYVVVSSKNDIKKCLNTFGLPNRYLDLEWGKFSGLLNEFIVPGELLKERVK